MKQILLAAAACLAVSPAMAANYCDSRGSNSSYEWIAAISLNGISQASGNNGGYLDATNKPPLQLSGKGDRLELRPGFISTQYPENWGVWIDFNQNATFESNELVMTAQGNTAQSAIINLPAGASGTTRMRVQMRWGSAAQPCGSYTYGETEDYLVQLPGAPSQAAYPYSLTLEPDFWVTRSGELGDRLTMIVEKDGTRVLGRNAAGNLRDRYSNHQTGSVYKIWLEAFINGAYKQVSNLITYRPGTTDRVLLSRDVINNTITPSVDFQGEWIIAPENAEQTRLPAQTGQPLRYPFVYGVRYQVWAEATINQKSEAISVPLAFREGFPSPYIDVEVEADFLLRHNGPANNSLLWVIREDGVEVFRQATGNASQLRYPFQTGRKYKVWLEQLAGNEWVLVSDAEYFSPGLSDQHQLTIDTNRQITRSGTLGESVTWVIEEGCNVVLKRYAGNELAYTHYRFDPNKPYRVWLDRFVDGYYQRVSNVVRYGQGSTPTDGSENFLPLYQLSVDANQLLTRSQGNHTMLTWVIEQDGVTVLERLASNELSYRYFNYSPGKTYRSWLKAYIDGRYQRVSPIVTY